MGSKYFEQTLVHLYYKAISLKLASQAVRKAKFQDGIFHIGTSHGNIMNVQKNIVKLLKGYKLVKIDIEF